MRFSLVLFALFASPAAADCTDEIAALFRGGALDPVLMPNRHEKTIAVHPEGSTSFVSDAYWDGVGRLLICFPGGCNLAIGRDAWFGDGPEGPWDYAGERMEEEPEAYARRVADDMVANLSEPLCPGTVQLNGRPALKYSYRTRTDPGPDGFWFGGAYSVWIDSETARVVQIAVTQAVSAAEPTPSVDMQLTTVTYDDAIRITPPAD